MNSIIEEYLAADAKRYRRDCAMMVIAGSIFGAILTVVVLGESGLICL